MNILSKTAAPALTALTLLTAAAAAQAQVVPVPRPTVNVPSPQFPVLNRIDPAVGARIRWGEDAFEAAIGDYRGNTPVFDPASRLNYRGAAITAWEPGEDYRFEINFDTLSGLFTLKVDFDDDGLFEDLANARDEIKTQSFGTDFAQGIRGIRIRTSAPDGVVAESQFSDLMINGSSVPDISFTNGVLNNFYARADGAGMGVVSITGAVLFERDTDLANAPTWDVQMLPVPEPSTYALMGLGLLGIAWSVRRRTAV